MAIKSKCCSADIVRNTLTKKPLCSRCGGYAPIIKPKREMPEEKPKEKPVRCVGVVWSEETWSRYNNRK